MGPDLAPQAGRPQGRMLPSCSHHTPTHHPQGLQPGFLSAFLALELVSAFLALELV